jgi:integrase
MVTKVPLKGLNIRVARGKWYVSPRAGGPSIVTGFVGTRDELEKHLASVEVMDAYQTKRKIAAKRPYAHGTLGALVALYTADGNERWKRLKPATKKDYEKVIEWLKPEFHQPLEWVDEVYVYDAQEKAVQDKWPRFADTMVSLLSAMFTLAVKRKLMRSNPARGVERVSRNDPNANREWTTAEFEAVLKAAPDYLKTPLLLARFLGYRGQTIAPLNWNQYGESAEHGRVMTVKARKNDEVYWLPCDPRLIAHLDAITRTATTICTTSQGVPWKNEQALQGAVSKFLRGLQADGLTGAGLTLHGLRVTFAAALKRERGATDKDVATCLGDRSERMGGHYTRHVEKEATIIRLFSTAAS